MQYLINFFQSYSVDLYVLLLFGTTVAIFIFLIRDRIFKFKISQDKNDYDKKKSMFFKLSTLALLILMSVLVCFDFFRGDPRYVISSEIVYIFGLIILLLLSDSVESLSIGNIITMKKEVKQKREEVKKLSTENSELRTQIVSIMNASISNQNRNQIILGIGERWLKDAKIEKANEEELTEENDATKDTIMDNKNDHVAEERIRFNKFEFLKRIEQLSIEKFAEKQGIVSNSIQHDVKFAERFSSGDPIMEQKIIFDGYIKRPLDELFVETICNFRSGQICYRLYYMISAIIQYAQINNKAAKLIILIPGLSEKWITKLLPYMNLQREIERIETIFKPAIKNGFLEIKVITSSLKPSTPISSQNFRIFFTSSRTNGLSIFKSACSMANKCI